MIRRAALLAAVLAANCGGHGVEQPNVIVIVMDTARGDRCSLQGYGRPTTPALDALAPESVVYRTCWSPSSWTAPAHASLFTGLRPEKHLLMDGARPYLDDGATTLAELFREAGYVTGGFSSNPNVGPSRNLSQGFDVFEGTYWLEQPRSSGYGDPQGRQQMPAVESSAAVTHERALRFVERARAEGRPFFLFLNHMEPHLAYDPPAEQAGRFLGPDADADREAWARGFLAPQDFAFNLGTLELSRAQLGVLGDLYDAEIATLDQEIGRFVQSLRQRELLDETVLVVTSDHGENLGDHGLTNHTWSLHASLLHVPLLIRYPPAQHRRGVVDDLVRLEDVPATLIDVCGLGPRPGLDGVTLTSDLAGRSAFAALGPSRERFEFLSKLFPEDRLRVLDVGLRSAFDGRHHLIRDSHGNEWLYDLAADRSETRNLAPAGGAEHAAMRALLARVHPR